MSVASAFHPAFVCKLTASLRKPSHTIFRWSLTGPTRNVIPLCTLNISQRRPSSFSRPPALDMDQVNTSSRLSNLRELMRNHKVGVYVVPSEDSHSSEYIASCDGRREFISGFSGSAGCAVVTLDKAALATDGRYFNQASKQLDSNWTLLRQGLQDVPTWQDWAAEQTAGGRAVGVDPELVAGSAAQKLADKIKKSGGTDLVPIKQNLVDLVWAGERPVRPQNQVVIHPVEYAGKDVGSKLRDLRQELNKKNSPAMVISMLDEIAWLFNLRGSDIPYNPVFFSYALVTLDDATLFVDQNRLESGCIDHLAQHGISIKPYSGIYEAAGALCSSVTPEGRKVAGSKNGKILTSNKTSWALQTALGGDKLVEEMRSPVGDSKAVKNDTEMAEDQLVTKKITLDEIQAADKLDEFRSKREHYVGMSFPTISSTGANAAVIHYKPERGACSVIDPNAVYLCDSGAQYRDGTTDVTRTVHFGNPTEAERLAYTLVLKGHIGLDSAVFPKGTTGFAIDCLARQFLWREGLDYRHGTGHGVGSFLNVHEGPIGIGTRVQYAEMALAPGNVVSIEPGFYEDGVFGIRIENLAMVKEVKTRLTFGDKPFLGFEHVTMVPYCRNLIDTGLLTEQEKEWINAHHTEILEKTQDLFQHDPTTLAWLKRETKPI